MEQKSGKTVFIIGGGAKEHALAQKLLSQGVVATIFAAPGNDAMKEICTCVDIRENAVPELLEFAMEHAVDLTVAVSENSIKADIAAVFNNNGLMIFAPGAQSAEIATSKSAGKKFMHKLHIPGAKFGVFDRANLAIDYAKNERMPIVIKVDEHRAKGGTLVCASAQIAKSFIEDCFLRDEKKVIAEEYVLGHEFSFYVVTDGYHALPLSSTANYKFALDGDGGLLTPGMGSYAQDYKISDEITGDLMNYFIYPAIDALSHQGTPYVGILGLDAVLTPENNVAALEFSTFLQDHDCQTVLALLEENLYYMMEACVTGAFADDYQGIAMSDDFAVSCVLSSGIVHGSVISGLDALDEGTLVSHFNTARNEYLEYETTGGRTLVVTRRGATIGRAATDLYDEVSQIDFRGKQHRKDLCAL